MYRFCRNTCFIPTFNILFWLLNSVNSNRKYWWLCMTEEIYKSFINKQMINSFNMVDCFLYSQRDSVENRFHERFSWNCRLMHTVFKVMSFREFSDWRLHYWNQYSFGKIQNENVQSLRISTYFVLIGVENCIRIAILRYPLILWTLLRANMSKPFETNKWIKVCSLIRITSWSSILCVSG